jgi:ATPase subunit of ABC transporter with duplicated ATPase domains
MLKTLLSTHDVAYATSLQKLFSEISITVKEKDRIGLLGNNGVGKTTFLKLLDGVLAPDSGTVINNSSIGYVPQITKESHQRVEVGALLHSRKYPYANFSKSYKSIFSSEVPAKEVRLDNMSGGERTKMWIALVVTNNPAILLLDEPTNDLDKKSIDELKRWINTFSGAIVFVSHNKSFLSYMAQTIWNLDTQTITVFGGIYEDFLQEKQYHAESQARQYESTKKEFNSLLKGERMRETKAAQAAKVSQKNKTESSRNKSAENYFRNRSEKGVGKIKKKHDAKRSELALSLHALRPAQQKSANLPLNSRLRTGGVILNVKNLTIQVDSTVFINSMDLRIDYGDRLAILGNNGVGKTLLVKKLIQEITNPQPETSRVGKGVHVAYIDQQYDVVDWNLSVFENLEHAMNVTDHELVYKQIGRFQFPEHYMHKKAAELSGGEIARLAFAIVTIVPLDLLILDEPTNNLDIETVNVILGALNDFRGSLVVISHDATFLDGLEILRSYVIEDGKFIND